MALALQTVTYQKIKNAQFVAYFFIITCAINSATGVKNQLVRQPISKENTPQNIAMLVF